MIDCTPSPIANRGPSSVSFNDSTGTPFNPPKRKKNIRVRKSIVPEEILSGGINAINVNSNSQGQSKTPFKKKLNLIDNVPNLKVQVNSTPSPKGEGSQNEEERAENTFSPKSSKLVQKQSFLNPNTEVATQSSKNNYKTDENQNYQQNEVSTPKFQVDKKFCLQAIRSMKTRSMTTSEKQKHSKIEDLLNSSTVLFADDDQMDI